MMTNKAIFQRIIIKIIILCRFFHFTTSRDGYSFGIEEFVHRLRSSPWNEVVKTENDRDKSKFLPTI